MRVVNWLWPGTEASNQQISEPDESVQIDSSRPSSVERNIGQVGDVISCTKGKKHKADIADWNKSTTESQSSPRILL